MCSPQILARAFSRAALERYVPRLQGALRREVRSWCAARGPVAVYEAAKALTFRMAARILLGLRLDEAQCSELARIFEQFVENLFSLPLDVPFSGLRKVLPPRPPQTFPLRLPWCAIGITSAGHGGSAQCGEVAWWRWALGLVSVLTRCVSWGGPHTLSGPRLAGRAPAPAAAGFPTLGLGGRRPASRPGPSPERRLQARPAAPLWKPRGWATDGSARAADTPPAQAGASRGWRGVGVGSPPAAPGPLVSGLENHGLFKLQSNGPDLESN